MWPAATVLSNRARGKALCQGSTQASPLTGCGTLGSLLHPCAPRSPPVKQEQQQQCFLGWDALTVMSSLSYARHGYGQACNWSYRILTASSYMKKTL